ncbi:hypothetical protein [Konateibacter massiliensis]|uniref:hypothetical protein n=1 Tax=Konateibacter massiliensis TaxID=2002841 RepID=UPI000C14902D|nr:hypothetical protein [Konateibacter massiliensis]
MKMGKSIIIVISLLVLTAFSGCSAISLLTQGEFDASGYVVSLLDAGYKGEFEQYIKLTKDTEENVQSTYDGVMEAKADGFISFVGATSTEELKEKYIAYSKQIFSHAKYEVANTTKTENGFTVELTVYPITLLEKVLEEGEVYVADFNQRNENGEFAEYTDEEFEAEYANGITAIFENNVANIEYAEPVTLTINLILSDGKVYEMSDADYTAIDGALLQ